MGAMKGKEEGLRRHEFGDPLEILLRREQGSCTGCQFDHAERVFGKEIKVCLKGRRHGKKCTKYKEKE